MLANWDNISQDGDNITFADMQKMPMLLFDAAVGDFNDSNKTKKADDDEFEKFDVEAYLKETLNISDEGKITKPDMESHLRTLLAETSANTPPETSNLIDSVVNVLAFF